MKARGIKSKEELLTERAEEGGRPIKGPTSPRGSQQLKVAVGRLGKAKREAKEDRNWRKSGEIHREIEA